MIIRGNEWKVGERGQGLGQEGASEFEDIIVPFADNVTQEEYGEALSYTTRNSTFLP